MEINYILTIINIIILIINNLPSIIKFFEEKADLVIIKNSPEYKVFDMAKIFTGTPCGVLQYHLTLKIENRGKQLAKDISLQLIINNDIVDRVYYGTLKGESISELITFGIPLDVEYSYDELIKSKIKIESASIKTKTENIKPSYSRIDIQ